MYLVFTYSRVPDCLLKLFPLSFKEIKFSGLLSKCSWLGWIFSFVSVRIQIKKCGNNVAFWTKEKCRFAEKQYRL